MKRVDHLTYRDPYLKFNERCLEVIDEYFVKLLILAQLDLNWPKTPCYDENCYDDNGEWRWCFSDDDVMTTIILMDIMIMIQF